MKIGDTIKRKGQPYTIVGLRRIATRDGGSTCVVDVTSPCAKCGEPFTLTQTPAGLLRRALNRRCPRHHAPGVPVKPRPAPARERRLALAAAAEASKREARDALTRSLREYRRQGTQLLRDANARRAKTRQEQSATWLE